MSIIKKFNEMNESNSYDGMTLKEFLGELGENKKGVNLTSNGIYTDTDENWLKTWGDYIITLEGDYSPKDIYDIYVKKEGEKYGHEFGKVLFKDGKPFIISGIPGDDMGAIVFNNTFVVSGHDGSYLFNISNPFDHIRNTR